MFIRIPKNLQYDERQIHLDGYRQWLNENTLDKSWKITELAPQLGIYQIVFYNDVDALAFKLRFGDVLS